MKLLLAITWVSPFLLLSYLLGRAATSARKRLHELLGPSVLALLLVIFVTALTNIITVAAMASGAPEGAVDWLLLISLLLAVVTMYVIGDDHQAADRRLVELKIGKWLSISISAIALAFVSVLFTSLLIQVVDGLPRSSAPKKAERWLLVDWLQRFTSRPGVAPTKGRKEPQAQTPAEFRAKLREQEAKHQREIKRYLKKKILSSSQSAEAEREEISDPQRFNGWQLDPGSLVPAAVPDLATRSSIALADNMYEAVFAPKAAASSIKVTLVVTKQDSPKQADEYLEPILSQYSFAADTATVESRAVRVGFLGGYNGKTAVYQQAFIGWTSSLFSFEIVARTSGYIVTDRALLYGPALQAAVATLRRAEPAIAASKPAH